MSTSPFLPHSAETRAALDELRAAGGRDHRHALKALAALTEISDAGPAEAADEVPPLPEDLRSRWHEAYGEVRTPAPQPVRRAARSGGFAEWLASLLQPRQLAWGGTFAAVLLLGMLAISHDWGARETGPTGPTTRGPNHVAAPAPSRRVVVIAPKDGSDALMRKLAEAYPTRSIERLDSAGTAMSGEYLLIDVAARTVSAQRNGSSLKEFPLGPDSLAAPDSVIQKIEDADEFLAQPGPSGQ